jgi:hypothetical protein
MVPTEPSDSRDQDPDDGRAAPRSRNDLVCRYKTILRQVIDRNPSGLRIKIAKDLGTHKSFLSQITNPADPTPIPARHIPRLFELCHFSRDEQRKFTTAYKKAHPERAASEAGDGTATRRTKVLRIEVPVLDDPKRQKALESGIRSIVELLTRVV